MVNGVVLNKPQDIQHLIWIYHIDIFQMEKIIPLTGNKHEKSLILSHENTITTDDKEM